MNVVKTQDATLYWGWWKFIVGVLFGVVLTYLYVRFGYQLPGVARLPATLSAEAIVATAESTLYDVNAPPENRRRALAVIVGQRPELFVDVNDQLDDRFYDEVIRRRAVREAKLLKASHSAYGKVLAKSALRAVYEKRYAETNDERIKRRMLIDAIRDKPLLSEWLDRRFPEADADRQAEIVLGVYQNRLEDDEANVAARNDDGAK